MNVKLDFLHIGIADQEVNKKFLMKIYISSGFETATFRIAPRSPKSARPPGKDIELGFKL